MKWRGLGSSLWEPLQFVSCTSRSQRLRTGRTPLGMPLLPFLSEPLQQSSPWSSKHSWPWNRNPADKSLQTTDPYYMLVFCKLSPFRSQQQLWAKGCSRLQYSNIHSTRDQDGREGKQQPPMRDDLGSQDTSVLGFGGGQGIVGSMRKFAVLRGLLKCIALNLFPQCAVIGLAWENSWGTNGTRASRARWGWGGPAHGLPAVTGNEQWRRSTCYCNEDRGAQLGCTSALHISAWAGAAAAASRGQGQHLRSSQASCVGQQCLMGSPVLSCQAPLPDGTVSSPQHWSRGGDESVCEHVTDRQ